MMKTGSQHGQWMITMMRRMTTEQFLQFEDIESEDEEPLDLRVNEINWDGNSDYFFPETPDFQDPLTFVEDREITAASSPYSILSKFLSEKVIDEIVMQTNLYATQKRIPNWKAIGGGELWRFLALNMLTGIVQKPSVKDYWTRDPLTATPYFNDAMSRNRFEQILRGLHFVDLEDPNLCTRDRFHKMGIIMPEIMTNFRKLVNPGEFLTLDEELMPYKGALSFKQHFQQHFPSSICSSSGKKTRGNCVHCWKTLDKKRKATSFRCESCKVWLCVTGENSCFSKYHKSSNSQNSQRPVYSRSQNGG